ncbi:hypothetical protein [Accumulibacter sp.]|uniref:hypothetical protein n=1 Tax=Accumulibacter sp. TaxID=2053492 RepID=UPI0028C3E24A|nr:hypothetical protein [Accumulibacter sp.]
MLPAGRIEGVASALAEFVECHPLAAVTPWLKPLEVCWRTEQRDAFEALGVELRCYFNVAPAGGEAVGDTLGSGVSLNDAQLASLEQLLPRLPTIGLLPHLAREISRTGGSPESLAYLNKLLRDHRDGGEETLPRARGMSC